MTTAAALRVAGDRLYLLATTLIALAVAYQGPLLSRVQLAAVLAGGLWLTGVQVSGVARLLLVLVAGIAIVLDTALNVLRLNIPRAGAS